MEVNTPLHAALAIHVRRARHDELAETLALLEVALTRRLQAQDATHDAGDVQVAFRLLRRGLETEATGLTAGGRP